MLGFQLGRQSRELNRIFGLLGFFAAWTLFWVGALGLQYYLLLPGLAASAMSLYALSHPALMASLIGSAVGGEKPGEKDPFYTLFLIRTTQYVVWALWACSPKGLSEIPASPSRLRHLPDRAGEPRRHGEPHRRARPSPEGLRRKERSPRGHVPRS